MLSCDYDDNNHDIHNDNIYSFLYSDILNFLVPFPYFLFCLQPFVFVIYLLQSSDHSFSVSFMNIYSSA